MKSTPLPMQDGQPFFHFDTEDVSEWPDCHPAKHWKAREYDDFWIIPVLIIALFTVLVVVS